MGLLLGTAASGLPPDADGPMSHWRLASEIRGANGLIGSEPGGLQGKTPGKYSLTLLAAGLLLTTRHHYWGGGGGGWTPPPFKGALPGSFLIPVS